MKKLVSVICVVLMISSCGIENVLDCYSGEFSKKELKLEKFTSLDIDVSSEITLMNGNEQLVIVEGREDMIRDLEKRSSVVNGEWRLRLRSNCINRSKETKITLVVPGLKEIDIDGNTRVFSREKLSNLDKNLVIEVDGNADIDLTTDLETLLMKIDGNSKLSLVGKANKMEINIDGNSTINCHDFIAKNVDLTIDGNGTANINCTEKLAVDIDGSGKVCYKGSPKIISKIDGIGKINNCN